MEKMRKHHWWSDVSSLTTKTLNENKWNKPKLLPVTKDIKTFNNYVTQTANKAYEEQKSSTGDLA